jgi:hypothetical protein
MGPSTMQRGPPMQPTQVLDEGCAAATLSIVSPHWIGPTNDRRLQLQLNQSSMGQSIQSTQNSQAKGQVCNIVQGFDDAAGLREVGLKLGDMEFLVVQGDPGAVIRGRQVEQGVCMKQTLTTIVVGICGKGVQVTAACLKGSMTT